VLLSNNRQRERLLLHSDGYYGVWLARVCLAVIMVTMGAIGSPSAGPHLPQERGGVGE
jgi:hypothetical protein